MSHLTQNKILSESVKAVAPVSVTFASSTPEKTATHVTVPESVKALYMSAWVASSKETRQTLLDTITASHANALVIDIKDYTGKISFVPTKQSLLDTGCYENKIKDFDDLVAELHKKNVYVIARIATFQDPCLVSKKPEDAVKNVSGGVWHDKKGITWLDASNKNSWPYFVDIAKEAYNRGVDEVNFDYIRFPTDGDMSAMRFSGLASSTKAFAIRDFFKYLDANLRDGLGVNYIAPKPVPKPVKVAVVTKKKNATTTKNVVPVTTLVTAIATTTPVEATPFSTSSLGSKIYNIKEFQAPKNRLMVSADIFGLVTEASDDMGIGQHFENVLPYVDYLSPMVYPSHYAHGYDGFPKPATEPYKVVYRAMSSAVERAKVMGQNPLKLRPWLQDFNLGATYTPDMVSAQMRATYETGLNSFLLWDPNNKYKSGAVALETYGQVKAANN